MSGISRRRREPGRQATYISTIWHIGTASCPTHHQSSGFGLDEALHNLRGEKSHSLARRRGPRQAISRSPLRHPFRNSCETEQNDHGLEGRQLQSELLSVPSLLASKPQALLHRF
jgi:hypothetical protein